MTVLGDQTAEVHFGVLGDYAQVAVEVAIGEDVTFADQRDVVFENALGARDVGVFALDFNDAIEQVCADAQSAFDQTDIFVAGAKEALNALVDGNACLHLGAMETSMRKTLDCAGERGRN